MTHRAFDGYVTNQTTNGVDGYTTTIRAQTATGTGSKGGNLILATGSGVSADGYVSIRTGNTERLKIAADGYFTLPAGVSIDGYIKIDGYTTIDGYEIIFDGYAVAPAIRQIAMPTPGIDGYTLTIMAQASTTSPAHGGDVVVKGGDGYNGDGYVRDGYVKLFSGSTESARAVPNKFYMISGQRVNISNVGTTPFTLTDGYFATMVDTGIAITINLPATPLRGDTYRIKDSTGNAGTLNIIVSGNGKNIDGAATKTITTNYGALLITYNGTQWSLLSTLGTVT